MKKVCLFVVMAMLLGLLPVEAQIRGNNINVMVVPDHQDWNYEVGQTAQFKVSVVKSSTLLNNVTVDYEAGPEMYPDVKKQGVVLKDGTMAWKGKMTKPGFYRLTVTAHVGGKDYKGSCTAAFSPEKLQPTTVMPADFNDYWQNAIKEARKIDLNPTKRLLPERCTKDVNAYEVSFQNFKENWRTYGILCVPVKEGRYPALLRVPGAGVRPYGGDVWTASQGAVTLEIGIHGISVTMEQKVYDDVFNGALMNYWNWGMDNRDDSYYKRVVLGCIRALDYIEQYTPWNGKEMGVSGSSQGGFLTLATAGLDKRITYYAPVHAALCDHTASLKGVACGWPHYFYKEQGARSKEQESSRKVDTSRYYDGVNFARLITDKQKGWFSFGYNDDVVPPTTAWATYNTVTGPKEISVYQQTAHFWYQEQWDEWENWMLKQMNLR
ncbi:MAG: acetylxylan esterase [Prevotella sp.]|nr:acetylxylan esterase [Prevotella sp.]